MKENRIKYNKPKEITILSQETLEKYQELFPLMEAIYVPFIKINLREKTEDLRDRAIRFDDIINEFNNKIETYEYLGSYDYGNGELIDFYLTNEYFFSLLYRIENDAFVEALFINQLLKAEVM